MFPIDLHPSFRSPSTQDDTLAFTIARLITDKLDSSNSALKETMSRQADDINSMLRRLSALEVRSSDSAFRGVG